MKREKRFCGYAGYYKEIYLRSTLEFIYASYLDYKSISWKYEPKVYYSKNGNSYKPDFLLEDGSIIEIKGTYYLEKDKQKVQPFIDELNLNITFLIDKDLRKLLRETPLSYDSLSKYWKQIAKRDNNNKGENNPKFGRVVSDITKERISHGVKNAWLDESYRYKQTENRRGIPNLKIRGVQKSKRVTNICPVCNVEFTLTEIAASKRKYCSIKCTGSLNIPNAVQVKETNTKNRYSKIKELTLKYAYKNKCLLEGIKLNRLQEFLIPLIEISYNLTGTKDIRVIATAVTGKPTSRKELILFLKSYIENVRRATENDESVELEDKKPLG